MIHYHGTPITPREKLLAELAGRHFCVSFAEPRDVEVCHQIGQSVMLDNGAFSFWRRPGSPVPDWDAWYEWATFWTAYPTTWAVLPDSIDGGVEENDRLLELYGLRFPLDKVSPVWHLHEPIDRLVWLCRSWPRVCFGSSGAYRRVGSDEWHRRVTDAFDAIAAADGRVPWIHMLRGMNLSGGPYPFGSVDSTTIAQEHAARPDRRKLPRDLRGMADEWDALQCPALWQRRGTQLPLEEAS